jgi:hypothetical protein
MLAAVAATAWRGDGERAHEFARVMCHGVFLFFFFSFFAAGAGAGGRAPPDAEYFASTVRMCVRVYAHNH